MRAAGKVVALLEFLSHAFPGFEPSGAKAVVWTAVLDPYDQADLMRAAELLARHHTFGKPSTAHVIEAIEGKTVRLPIFVTDHSGCRVLRAGAPVVERYEEVKIPYGQPVEQAALPAPAISNGQIAL